MATNEEEAWEISSFGTPISGELATAYAPVLLASS